MTVDFDRTTPSVNDSAGPSGSPLEPGGDSRERMATVLQVLPALGNQGGVERGTVEVAAAVVEAGGRAIVASSGGPLEHDLKRVGAMHVTLPLDSKNPFTMRANATRLAALIKAESVDLVHARSRAPAWSAYWACKRVKTPFLTTFHGTYNIGSPMKRWYNSVMTKGDLMIAISNFIAGHVRQAYGVANDKIRIIHRGVDLNRFSPTQVSAERLIKLSEDWQLGDGYPVVLLPGRLTRWKGQTVFINAIVKLKRRDIRCVIVGSDQGRTSFKAELEGMIERHDLGGVVRMLDHCGDMPAAYMLSDIVVSASTDPEAFGRVVAEAQALGRPVIATNHGGAKEILLENETGWLVPPNDPDAMAQALERALKITPEARKVLAARAIERVQQNFSRAAMCAKTLEVYDEILGKSRR